MLDETVETRRPWRGSPRPCVHAVAFLCLMGIISTVSKPLRYSRFGRVRVSPVPGAYVPYVVAKLLQMMLLNYTCLNYASPNLRFAYTGMQI